MSDLPERKCPDCHVAMQPIVIIDRSRYSELLAADSALTYTSPTTKPGWLGDLPPEGVVSAVACTQCGRILLYAMKS